MHNYCNKELTLEDLQSVSAACPHCQKEITDTGLTYVNDKTEPIQDERAFYTNRFIDVADEIIALARGAKTSDYAETWKKPGLKGLFIKILIKYGRLENLIWKKDCSAITAVKGESIRDTLKDLAAYAIYAIIAFDEKNIVGSETEFVMLKEMRDEIEKKIKAVEKDG